MFSNKLFWLSMSFLLLLHDGVQAEECCKGKTVGDVSYSLLTEDFTGSLPPQCLNNCVYTKSGTSSPKFCFARGDLQPECLSETFAETLSSGCIIETNIFYAGHDVAPEQQATSKEDCACICRKTLGCYFWSYYKPGGECTFHNSKAGRTPNKDFTSGNLACWPRGQPCPSGTEVMPSYADQYRGCCSWRNITGSTGKDGFYIISAPHENVTDSCSDGCTYTKIEDQTQHCLPASSADDAECNSCNQCAGTDFANLVGVDQTCKETASEIVKLLAKCTAECLFSGNKRQCIVDCIEQNLIALGIIIPNVAECIKSLICPIIKIC